MVSATACARPTLIALERATGPPHALVMVQGSALDFARIVWDAGTADEKTIPGGFLGAYMFSVPPGTTPGPHAVAIENGSGRSVSATFTVTAAVVFPAPRIDYVTLVGTQFDGSSHVTPALYVQGADFDIGAVVLVGGVEVATIAHKALVNDWHGVPARELGYPIYHYVSTVVLPGPEPAGSTLGLTVRNLDGKLSPVFQYKLPADAASVDSDGDGLLDSWETRGYDANGDGVIDVNLPTLGASPLHRDLLVQIDVMDNLVNPPQENVFEALKSMFRSAPILNPVSDSGIDLILDRSHKPCLANPLGTPVCSFQTITFDTADSIPDNSDPFTSGRVNFSKLKAKNFDNAVRDKIYHYGIWGIDLSSGLGGQSDLADDFVITIDCCHNFDATFQTPKNQLESLAHELGHDLRQFHGGGEDEDANYQPNYWSVMSYTWDLRTGGLDTSRLKHATCAPMYYVAAGASELNGAVASNVSTVTGYSEGMARTLVPGKAKAPPLVICGETVDWAGDGNGGAVKDFANWRALKFDGPAINGYPTAINGIQP